MVIAGLRILVPSEKRQEIAKALRSFAGPTPVQPGCISCRVCQDIENQDALGLLEAWESQEDLDRHIRSDEYRKILATMDFSVEAPEISFHTVSYTAGTEVVKAARGSKQSLEYMEWWRSGVMEKPKKHGPVRFP